MSVFRVGQCRRCRWSILWVCLQRRRCRWPILCECLQCRSASAVSMANFVSMSSASVSVGGVGGQFYLCVFRVGQCQRCRWSILWVCLQGRSVSAVSVANFICVSSASAVSVANFMGVSSASAVSVANFMGMSSASVSVGSVGGKFYGSVFSVNQCRRCRWPILWVCLQR